MPLPVSGLRTGRRRRERWSARSIHNADSPAPRWRSIGSPPRSQPASCRNRSSSPTQFQSALGDLRVGGKEPAMTTREIEFGLDTPAYVSVDESGQPLDGEVVVRNTVEEGVFADSVGIDSFNINEHYRPDFMDSAGHVMLAAIAGRTKHIPPGTPPPGLSTHDPGRGEA